ncbi:hypothetical protein Tco_0370008 [Tanacetum coccineum]
MITYLKNMEGWKHKELKSKDFDSIKELFDKAFTRVNMFVEFRTELVEGSSKRAREELEQESTKKQKVDEDKDTAELQSLMEVIPDEKEVAIDVVPLATKVFSQMLKSFTREDLEDLYKLVKAKYGSTRPVEDLDFVLWNDLKTILQSEMIYMLVEKRHPLAPPTIIDMMNKKLQINIKFRGGLLGLEVFLMLFGVTAALINVNAAQLNKQKHTDAAIPAGRKEPIPLSPPTTLLRTDATRRSEESFHHPKQTATIKQLTKNLQTHTLIDVMLAQTKVSATGTLHENYSKCLRTDGEVTTART